MEIEVTRRFLLWFSDLIIIEVLKSLMTMHDFKLKETTEIISLNILILEVSKLRLKLLITCTKL